jgi:hypothetical protein
MEKSTGNLTDLSDAEVAKLQNEIEKSAETKRPLHEYHQTKPESKKKPQSVIETVYGMPPRHISLLWVRNVCKA